MLPRARLFRLALSVGVASMFAAHVMPLAVPPLGAYCGVLTALSATILAWRHPRLRIGMILVVFATLVILRLSVQLDRDGPFLSTEPLREVKGTVLAESIMSRGKQYVLLGMPDYRMIGYLPQYPVARQGSMISFSCVPRAMTDRELWLQRRYGTSKLCEGSSIVLLQEGGSLTYGALSGFRSILLATINEYLPVTHAQLLGGMLIGARQSFSAELKEAFNRIGLTHIIAVSGYNVTILLALLSTLCTRVGVGRRISFAVIIISIILFTVLAGGSAATLRASIMGGLAVIAQYIGRKSRMGTAILLACAIMVFQNPSIFFDIGFQLSFLAMMGLIYISPFFEALFAKMSDAFGLKPILIQTLSAICATSPMILWYFQSISLIAPLANLVILPVVPMGMAFGAAATMISLIGSSIGGVFFTSLAPYVWAFAWAPLEYAIQMSLLFSRIPFASITIQHPLVVYAIVLCSYALLAVLVARVSARRQKACAVS